MPLPKSLFSNRCRNLLAAGLFSAAFFCALPYEATAQAADLEKVTDLNAEPLSNTAFTIRVLPNRDAEGKESPVTKEAVQSAITTIQKRMKGLGIKGFDIQAHEKAQIVLELENISKTQLLSARTALTRSALLELKLVHPESHILADRVAADPDNEVVPGYELKVYKDIDGEGKATSENILIKRRGRLNGSYVTHAQEQYGAYEGTLSVELNSEGAQLMFDLTSKMQAGRDRLAIVLDGEVLSAPVVQSALRKHFEITGMNDAKDAKELATALMTPLKNPLKIEDERQFEPKPEK